MSAGAFSTRAFLIRQPAASRIGPSRAPHLALRRLPRLPVITERAGAPARIGACFLKAGRDLGATNIGYQD